MAGKSKKKTITEDLKEQINKIVQEFNETELKGTNVFYITRFRQDYLYLDRDDDGMSGRICRLKYTGKMDEWEFAIYKYSNGAYDPDEWVIPGMSFIDGTIKGAMKAGLEAYEPF